MVPGRAASAVVLPITAEAFLLARELETVAATDLILAGDLNSSVLER